MNTCDFCQTPFVYNDRVKAEIPNCACLRTRSAARVKAEREATWTLEAVRRVELLRLGTLSDHDKKAPTIEGWEDPSVPILAGKNLLVTGPVGTKKTTLLKQVSYNAALSGLKVRGGNVVEMLSRLKDMNQVQNYSTWLEGGHLLVLDDLDKMMGTQYEVERLFFVVDRYWSFGRSIAASFNRTIDELEAKMARDRGTSTDKAQDVEAIISRLTGNATIVHLKGPDIRQRPA
jgi:DNA replication protein DnaC